MQVSRLDGVACLGVPGCEASSQVGALTTEQCLPPWRSHPTLQRTISRNLEYVSYP